MQIVNGQPTFGPSDVVFRNDGQYAYDGQNNVMGLWNGNAGAGMPGAGNPLNTDQMSFLDYLKQNNGAGLGGGPGLSLQSQNNGPTINDSLGGSDASMWGGNSSNPYYAYMLQLLSGGNPSYANPNWNAPQQSSGQGMTPTGYGGYGHGI